MDKAATDRIEQQVRQAFPEDAITRIQILQYGDDPEVEPGQAAMRSSSTGRAGPKAAKPTLRPFTGS